MMNPQAKTLPPGSKVKERNTGDIYVVDHIESPSPGRVLIYARHEETRKPVCFDPHKVDKVHLIDSIKEKMVET